MAARAIRIDDLDKLLERQLLVCQGAEHGHLDAVDELGEGGIPRQVGAQGERVGEEAEQLLRLFVMAPGHRGADDDVLGRAVAVQQCLEGRRQNREQGHAASLRQLAKRTHDLSRDVKLLPAPAIAGDTGTRPVAGKLEPVGSAAKLLRPVLEQLVEEGAVLMSALPLGEVRVLDRKNRQLWLGPLP